MTRVLVIGIGTGNPEHLTLEAIRALNEVDVFLVADKGPETADLVMLRQEICRTHIRSGQYRVVEVADPSRGPDRGRDAGAYREAVDGWHRRRAEHYASVVAREVAPGGTVGFLVWGDPAFYDSTIRIVELVRESGTELELTVIPGISSLQVLAARHRIVLNRVGQPIHVTTGRRLLAEYDPTLGDVAVMLDADLTCAGLRDTHPGLQIYWAAQLGLADEALAAGALCDVVDDIRATRKTDFVNNLWRSLGKR